MINTEDLRFLINTGCTSIGGQLARDLLDEYDAQTARIAELEAAVPEYAYLLQACIRVRDKNLPPTTIQVFLSEEDLIKFVETKAPHFTRSATAQSPVWTNERGDVQFSYKLKIQKGT